MYDLFIFTDNNRGCTIEEYQLYARSMYPHFEVAEGNVYLYFKPNGRVVVLDEEDVEKNGNLCKEV